jgi:hypothetical protein
MLLEFFFWLTSALDPVASAHTAAQMVGEPGMEVELLRICHRESRCKRVGVHAVDEWASPRVYERAVAAGWVSPGCQPYRPRAWSSRGPWGLMAAYNLKWAGVPCLQPWVLDFPLVSAVIAARKLKAHCETSEKRRHPAIKRWARCDWRKSRKI